MSFACSDLSEVYSLARLNLDLVCMLIQSFGDWPRAGQFVNMQEI